MDEEFFMDWRVWGLCVILGAFMIPILFKQMIVFLPKWKAVIILIMAFFGSYLFGKIVIDKGS